MSKRIHNIYFHLHTVSGISITVGLFIIFFAGAFTLFEKPIAQWEHSQYAQVQHQVSNTATIDYNRVIDSLEARGIALYGRDLNIRFDGNHQPLVNLSGTADTTASKKLQKERLRYTLNTADYRLNQEVVKGRRGGTFSLGRLLYLLHFYYQLDLPGYYLAGLVSLFFFLALVSGVIVHWKKITLNFFVFRPKQKLKTVWTDAHTVLGTIGIPFQFLYALSGCMFGLGVLVYTSSSVMYNGEVEEVYQIMFPRDGKENLGEKTDLASCDFNAFYEKAQNHWENFEPTNISILHLGSTTQKFKAYGYGDIRKKFINQGELVFNTQTNEVLKEISPYDKVYSDHVRGVLYRLHYADFGGLGNFGNNLLKIIYFIMAILTCFVIITGVLIWLEARNKKSIPEKKKRYNQRVGYLYLAICLSMLPITAASFVFARLLPQSMNNHRELALNCFFFLGWLVLSMFFTLKKSNYFTNKYTLLVTGVIGLCIPVVNGAVSGNWLWRTIDGNYNVFSIDALWLCLGAACLYAVSKLNVKPKTT